MPTTESRDFGPAWTPQKQNSSSADTTAALTIITAAATKRILIDDLWITSAVAQSISIKNSVTGTVLVGPLDVTAGMLLPLTFRNTIDAEVDGEGVTLLGTLAGAVKCHARFHYRMN